MKFTDTHIEEFDRNGCVILKNVITSEHARELRSIVHSLADIEKKFGESYFYEFDKSGKTQRVWNLVNKRKEFRNLLETT